MATKKQSPGDPHEKAARAKLSLRASSKQRLVQIARSTVSNVKKSADYATEPKVQQATTAFEAATDALQGTLDELAILRAREHALLSTQAIQVVALKRSGRMVIAVIEDVAGGSAAKIAAWGFEVARATAPMVERPLPPQNLRVTYDKSLKLTLRWDAVVGQLGYTLQMGDGSVDQWGEPMHVTRASYEPTGLKLGQTAKFRVSVHRASGESAFSDTIAFTVR